MFGIRYLKVPPTTYVMHYKDGRVAREGAGLSFFYFGPTAEIVQVPLASVDVPFVFNEVTADHQDAAIQGDLTYRVAEPKKLAAVLDYSVDGRGRFRSDDPQKLSDRLSHAAQTAARSFTESRPLRDVLTSSEALVTTVLAGLRQSPAVEMLGIEVLGLSILSIRPTPEIVKAMQAEARENLLRQADEAVYARRNNAVQLERMIKENEFNTEIAVEEKRRQVRETQMAAEMAIEEKRRQVREIQMAADVAIEQQRASLVDQKAQNDRVEADVRAYALRASLEPLKDVDWKTLLAASAGAGDPKLNIAVAFRELAENAGKIGELNISPDLLNTLLAHKVDATP